MDRGSNLCSCQQRRGIGCVGGVGDTSQISLFLIALAMVVSLGLLSRRVVVAMRNVIVFLQPFE